MSNRILRESQAGTLESSDIMITVAPLPEGAGRKIELTSPIMNQYGRQIENTILDMLKRYELDDLYLVANDRGALDCTIQARLETALKRALGQGESA